MIKAIIIFLIIFIILLLLPVVPYTSGQIKRTLEGGSEVQNNKQHLSLIKYSFTLYNNYKQGNYIVFYKSNLIIFIIGLALAILISFLLSLFLIKII